MKRLLPSLLLTVPLFIGCPGGESSDDDTAAAFLLLAAGGQTTCILTSANHGTTEMPLITLNGTSSATVPATSDSHAHWFAVAVPAVKEGTTVTFSFAPEYTPGGPSMLFVYETGSCPLHDSTPSEIHGSGSTTLTAWDSSKHELSVGADGAGKDLIIVGAPATSPTGETVTRTDP